MMRSQPSFPHEGNVNQISMMQVMQLEMWLFAVFWGKGSAGFLSLSDAVATGFPHESNVSQISMMQVMQLEMWQSQCFLGGGPSRIIILDDGRLFRMAAT